MTRAAASVTPPASDTPPGHPSGLRPLRGMALLMLALLLLALAAVLGGRHLTRIYLADTAARGENTMRLAVAGLRGELARYDRLPQLIAQQETLRELLRHPDEPMARAAADRYLLQTNRLLGSSDIYVMQPDGRTVAASNFNTPTPFVGQNFAYRPYFREALEGGQGRFFGLGTTSGRRGYYFAAPVRETAARGGRILGVVAFKIDLERIEESWRAGDYEITVTDPEGIIFMSARRDWLFSAIPDLTEEMIDRAAAVRRYASIPLRDLPLRETGTAAGHTLLTLALPDGSSREFLQLAEEMPQAGWTVRVLLDTASARAQAWTATLAAVLALGLAMAALAVWLQRRHRLRDRLALQAEARQMLERRVEERTAELAELNLRLGDEVAERRATETELRQTQSRLIQSGKLAALGQMSAALSHEFNQPLGAVRNFADNALAYIDRGRVTEARGNVERILGLADRMTEISRTLRNFARKPNSQLSAVDPAAVLAEAREVIGWRLASGTVRIESDLPDPAPLVVAGPVRLQQVLVNLLSNALDTLEGRDDPLIRIRCHPEGDRLLMTVSDNGPGIPAALIERIFDPFFSTKGVGRGLGLGLSISYNIIKDFGGELRAENAPGGGAVFTIELTLATPETSATAGETQ